MKSALFILGLFAVLAGFHLIGTGYMLLLSPFIFWGMSQLWEAI